MATATKKKPKAKSAELRGGNSNKPATDEPLIPSPESNGKPAETDEPKPIGEAVDKVVNRVKGKVKGPHVSEGDWQAQRKSDLKEIYNRRDEIVDSMEQLKEEFAAKKSAKKAVDAELLIAVRDLDKPYPPRPQKLYPDPEEGKGKKSKTEPSKNGTPTPPADDDSWRSVPLASLSIPPGILEKLANPIHKHRGAVPPIKTVGDITDFLKPVNGWEPRLVDIAGIGKTAVDKIDAALETFWDERAKAAPASETKEPITATKEPKAEEKTDATPAASS